MNATATISTQTAGINFPDGTSVSGLVITTRLRASGTSVETHACEGRFLMVRRTDAFRGTGAIDTAVEIDADTYNDIAARAARLIDAQEAAGAGLAMLIARASR
jgi:hypothetical protein